VLKVLIAQRTNETGIGRADLFAVSYVICFQSDGLTS